MSITTSFSTITPQGKFLDRELSFRGFGMHPSKCRVRAFHDMRDRRNIVVVMTDKEGTSVTNAGEQIASEALAMLGDENLRNSITWIEHYEADSEKPESFSFVTFSSYDAHGKYFAKNSWGRCFSGMRWYPATRSEVLDLIGGAL